MRLTYHPEAEAELVAAAEFYESRSPTLGEEFLREFDVAISEVQKNPTLWTVVEGDVRCHTIRRFPFSIYYRVLEDELRILVIHHHNRHPEYWRHRLAD